MNQFGKMMTVIGNGIFCFIAYLDLGILFAAYLAVANLARLGISVCYQVSARSQYLVSLFS